MTERRHVTPWAWRAWGAIDSPALLALHGFTGCAGFWAPFAKDVAPGWHVLAPDLPGHGATGDPFAGNDMAAEADSLANQLDGPVTVLGYSLGGRLALHLALRHPALVRRLVLVGASAGLESPDARAERREADARWIRMLREDGLDAFLAAWEAQPLFATQAEAAPERLAWLRDLRCANRAEGLARSLEAFGLGTQDWLAPALATCAVPTTWVAGERDAKFSAIARDMAALMPHAEAVIVPGAGHNVVFERPEAIGALLTPTT
jgi:2-succinyl-6-hydroxy-2,4-cyclohexadiene-1-carboxylate synthase